MKKSILTIAIVAILASCSNHKPADQATTTPSIDTKDTIGLSDYKEWKQRQELQAPQQTFTSPGVNDVVQVPDEKPAPKVIYRDAPARQPHVVKTSRPARQSVYKAPVEETDNRSVTKTPPPPSSDTKREPYGRGTGTEGTAGSGASTSTNGDGDVAVTTPAPEVPAKKEGWSKAAKGTAVGGASGAVIGAVISKDKTKGAVIGGIVGAAGGYIFGRNKDKKDGRTQ